MKIASFFMQNRLISGLVTLLLVFGGWQAFEALPRLEDPDFIIKEAMVITRYPGASPEQVELEVTFPIENAIQQLAYVDHITSISSTGLSQITVKMQNQYGPDELPQIWDELRRKVGDLKGTFPPGVQTPWVNDDYGDVFGLMIAVFGDGYAYSDLRDYVDLLTRELVLVEGVGKVALAGQQAEQVFVELSMHKLGTLGIPVDRFYDLLETQNTVSNAGGLMMGSEYIRFHPTGEFDDVEELGDLIVSLPGETQLIHLRDVATIRRDYQDIPSNVYLQDGREAIALGVSFASGSNVVEVGRAIEERLQELEYERPWGLETAIFYNQPAQVVEAIDAFLISLAQAVAIVIAVLMVFMGLRSALLVGGVLLVTIMGTFVFMNMQGLELQRISLGALVVALGMLVDNAIVVVDGISTGMQRGSSKREAADAIVGQTLWPLLGATVIAIIAFAPIGLSDDATGEIAGSLFWVLLYALFLSWFTAITITPFFAELLLKVPDAGGAKAINEDPYQGLLFSGFKALLDIAMRFRWLTILLMVALLAMAIQGFGLVKNEFFPPMNSPIFTIDLWLPQGTDIRDNLRQSQVIERALREIPEVNSVTTTVGRGAMRFMLPYKPEKPYGSYTQFLVRTNDLEGIQFAMDGAFAYLAGNHAGAQVNFKRLMVGPQPDGKIEARISGPDPEVLRNLSTQIRDIYRQQVAGFAVRDDWRSRQKVMRPQFSEAQARRAGVSKRDIDDALLTSFAGKRIGLYRDGTRLLPIILRPPELERNEVGALEEIKVWSPVGGAYMPLTELVTAFNVEWEDALIVRRDRRRTITVMMDPHPSHDGTVTDLHDALRAQVEALALPEGYSLEWGGEFEKSNDAKEPIFRTLPMGFLAMFIITVLLFNSVKKTVVVWCTVPLAVIGVTCGLLLAGKPFSFMALLGMLSLSGMVIKNGIVLMDQISVESGQGAEPYQAVFGAAVSRLRPVSMAALTTILGMIPLLPDLFFQSMAVTIMAGLGFATVLTLVVVPVLYVTFFRLPYQPRAAP
ncbi:MAG: efflux RND transporter permease subunit [Deltaproteobacteria bacterium]|nr:efflux RND transporter permease subunit [Deltaproteobacteria bacterium]